jgi:2-oxoglutarate ferredoxin oxidoreductase subunit delta
MNVKVFLLFNLPNLFIIIYNITRAKQLTSTSNIWIISLMTEKGKKMPVISREWCKGCRICVEFCPEHALTMDDMEKATLAYPEKCTGCKMCELRCPDLAIEIK